MKIVDLFEDLGNLHSLNAGPLLKMLHQSIGWSGTVQPVSNRMSTGLIGPGSVITTINAKDGLSSIRKAIQSSKDIAGFCVYLDNNPVVLVTIARREHHARHLTHDPDPESSDELTLGKPNGWINLAYDFRNYPKITLQDIEVDWEHNPNSSQTSIHSGSYDYNKGKEYVGQSSSVSVLRAIDKRLVAVAKADGLAITAKLISYDLGAIDTKRARNAARQQDYYSSKRKEKADTLGRVKQLSGDGDKPGATFSKKDIIKGLLTKIKEESYANWMVALEDIAWLKTKVSWPELNVIQAALKKRMNELTKQ